MEGVNKQVLIKIYCPEEQNAELFDRSNRLIWVGLLFSGLNNIDFSFLKKGTYFLKVGFVQEFKEIEVK